MNPDSLMVVITPMFTIIMITMYTTKTLVIVNKMLVIVDKTQVKATKT